MTKTPALGALLDRVTATAAGPEVLEEADARVAAVDELSALVDGELTEPAPLLRPAPLPAPSGPYHRLVKPVCERGLAAVALLLAAPVLAVAAIAVAVSVGRPALFRQERVGLHGRVFEILKLRTMLPDRRTRPRHDYDGLDRRQTHKSPDDPRVTGVGRFLRHWSIDELPQLWNVVRGDMALVGPRPELPHIVADHYAPAHHDRHLVRPGITGLWQVTERGEGDMHLYVDVDLQYVARSGPGLDAAILLRTPLAALGMRRGY